MFHFPRYSVYRDLHSFPTRRSSDLVVPQDGTPPPPAGDWADVALAEALDGFERTLIARALSAARGNVAEAARRLATRSEEHTSELQSHHDLVCRLLLEKKKIPVTLL